MGNDQKAREQLGKKLKLARQKKKLTQSDIADRADINVNYYARIERGEENPSLDTLRSIAKILNVIIQV